MIPAKTIFIYLALISILLRSWISGKLFHKKSNGIQTRLYSFFQVLLLAGIKKESGSMFTMKLKTAIQRMLEECGITTRGEIISGTSAVPFSIYAENKEEAYRSKESTTKFMLQKWQLPPGSKDRKD